MLDVLMRQGDRLIHYIRPVSPRAADGLVAEVYAQVARDFVLAPPVTLHASAPELLAGAWMLIRETLVVGRVPRRRKETVAAAVSQLNACPFCVDIHSMMMHASAAVEPGWAELADPLAAWALATRTPGATVISRPPFPAQDAPEIVGTAVAFHYINRVVNVFLDELPISRLGRFRDMSRRLLALAMHGSARRSRPLGDSLSLLPAAELPEDLAWTRSNPAVAGAYARFAAAVEAYGRETLPDGVRRLVTESLGRWSGEDPGLGAGWLDAAIARLPDQEQPAGRLALLSAIASYRVDERVVNAFRRDHPADRDLVGAVAWASFAAARRTGSWLAAVEPSTDSGPERDAPISRSSTSVRSG